MLRYLYCMCLWFAEFDLAIARSTGRNPAHINVLQGDVQKWELLLWELDWRMK